MVSSGSSAQGIDSTGDEILNRGQRRTLLLYPTSRGVEDGASTRVEAGASSRVWVVGDGRIITVQQQVVAGTENCVEMRHIPSDLFSSGDLLRPMETEIKYLGSYRGIPDQSVEGKLNQILAQGIVTQPNDTQGHQGTEAPKLLERVNRPRVINIDTIKLDDQNHNTNPEREIAKPGPQHRTKPESGMINIDPSYSKPWSGAIKADPSDQILNPDTVVINFNSPETLKLYIADHIRPSHALPSTVTGSADINPTMEDELLNLDQYDLVKDQTENFCDLTIEIPNHIKSTNQLYPILNMSTNQLLSNPNKSTNKLHPTINKSTNQLHPSATNSTHQLYPTTIQPSNNPNPFLNLSTDQVHLSMSTMNNQFYPTLTGSSTQLPPTVRSSNGTNAGQPPTILYIHQYEDCTQENKTRRRQDSRTRAKSSIPSRRGPEKSSRTRRSQLQPLKPANQLGIQRQFEIHGLSPPKPKANLYTRPISSRDGEQTTPKRITIYSSSKMPVAEVHLSRITKSKLLLKGPLKTTSSYILDLTLPNIFNFCIVFFNLTFLTSTNKYVFL